MTETMTEHELAESTRRNAYRLYGDYCDPQPNSHTIVLDHEVRTQALMLYFTFHKTLPPLRP